MRGGLIAFGGFQMRKSVSCIVEYRGWIGWGDLVMLRNRGEEVRLLGYGDGIGRSYHSEVC